MKRDYSVDNRAIFGLVLLVFILKLSLLPFAQTTDADAVSRVFLSLNWLEHPHWIKTSVWAPFHFYITGFALYLWNDLVYSPKVVNLIFSSLTLIPFYFFTKREFNKNGAFIAAVFLAFSPVLFRNSFLALSETPYLFFLMLSLNYLSRGIRENSQGFIALAGVSITIAAGLRYEAWLLMIILGAVLLVYKKWRLVPVYSLTSLLFPISWIISNWMETGNPMHGIQGNYKWTLEMMGNNDYIDLEEYARRIWFFPFAWMIAIGIPTGFIILKTLFKGYLTKTRSLKIIIYSLPFLIMFGFFMYNAFKGVLLLQQRFSGTLVMLSLPFIAMFFERLDAKKVKQAIGFGLFPVIMSFLWNTSGVKMLPRLQDQSAVEITTISNKNLSYTSALIIDNLGWENTYYIALNTNIPHQNILINGGAKNSKIPFDRITDLIQNFQTGVVLLQKNSPLSNWILDENFEVNHKKLKFKRIYENDEVICYRFSLR